MCNSIVFKWRIIIKHSDRAFRSFCVVCPNDWSEQQYIQQQVWHVAYIFVVKVSINFECH
jgi:hypothetical protein